MPADRFTVDDVRLGARDATESVIEHIYAKAPPLYSVYRNRDRVAVQYSDNESLADQQRSATARLSVLRSEINGLIDGWRRSSWHSFQARARRYDGEVAAALIQCLEEGNPENARSVMQQTRDDVLGERISWGKSEYLIYASIAAAIAVLILTFVQHRVFPFKTPPDNIWLAARAGTAGAFFSVAWGIWGKSIQPNIRGRDNVSDAILRIIVGMIAAGVLLLLLGAALVPNITIGDAHVSGTHMTWQIVLIVGFLAGFVERLVPGLLDNAPPQPGANTARGGGQAQPAAPGGGNPSGGQGQVVAGGTQAGQGQVVAGATPGGQGQVAAGTTPAGQGQVVANVTPSAQGHVTSGITLGGPGQVAANVTTAGQGQVAAGVTPGGQGHVAGDPPTGRPA